jgi:hypothetical protein
MAALPPRDYPASDPYEGRPDILDHFVGAFVAAARATARPIFCLSCGKPVFTCTCVEPNTPAASAATDSPAG